MRPVRSCHNRGPFRESAQTDDKAAPEGERLIAPSLGWVASTLEESIKDHGPVHTRVRAACSGCAQASEKINQYHYRNFPCLQSVGMVCSRMLGPHRVVPGKNSSERLIPPHRPLNHTNVVLIQSRTDHPPRLGEISLGSSFAGQKVIGLQKEFSGAPARTVPVS